MVKFAIKILPVFLLVGALNGQNVGIGTPFPVRTLHVEGTMRLTRLVPGITIDSVLFVDANGDIGGVDITTLAVLTEDKDWFKSGTTNAPRSISNSIYTMGYVGIGISTPSFALHISPSGAAQDASVVASGAFGSGEPMPSGPQTAFIWSPKVVALRAGRTTGNHWDPSSVGTYSVAFAYNNIANGEASSVLGGKENTASGQASAIASGRKNIIKGNSSFIGSGDSNYIDLIYLGEGYNAIASGYRNYIKRYYSFIGSGDSNVINGYVSLIGTGQKNVINAHRSAILVGRNNVIAGGRYDNVILSGNNNHIINSSYTLIGIGENNQIRTRTHAADAYNIILVGQNSVIDTSGFVSILSGASNTLKLASHSTIISGNNNIIKNAHHSIIIGGRGNVVENTSYVLVFGEFVTVDTSQSHRAYFFGDDALGALAINRNSADNPIHVGTTTSNGNGAFLSPGGVWTNASSSTFKDRIDTLNPQEVLRKVRTLTIPAWHYKKTEERHISPMAEDFHNLFAVGVLDNPENKNYLSALDVAGVALISVKALDQNINELKQQLEQLKLENEALKQKIKELESIIKNNKH